MTSGHILFIPGIALVGMFLGFLLGVRAAKNQFDLQRKRDEERAAARAARAQKASSVASSSASGKPAE